MGFFSLLSPSHLPISILAQDAEGVVASDKHFPVLLRLILHKHLRIALKITILAEEAPCHIGECQVRWKHPPAAGLSQHPRSRSEANAAHFCGIFEPFCAVRKRVAAALVRYFTSISQQTNRQDEPELRVSRRKGLVELRELFLETDLSGSRTKPQEPGCFQSKACQRGMNRSLPLTSVPIARGRILGYGMYLSSLGPG